MLIWWMQKKAAGDHVMSDSLPIATSSLYTNILMNKPVQVSPELSTGYDHNREN